jgi:hypothetical protein
MGVYIDLLGDTVKRAPPTPRPEPAINQRRRSAAASAWAIGTVGSDAQPAEVDRPRAISA